MKTIKEVRKAFWEYLKEVEPELAKHKRSRKTQNDYCTDIRVQFCEYIEYLRRDNIISERLAYNVTL